MPRADQQELTFHLREVVLGAVEYIVILALIALPLFLLQVYTAQFTGYVTTIENLSFAPPYTSGVTLNYLGFILPLIISIPLAISIRSKAHILFEGRLKKFTLFFMILYAVIGFLSVKYPLTITISTGSGLLPLEFITGVYLFCISLCKPDSPKLVVPTAYILGAVTSALSDVISYAAAAPIKGVLMLGAYGLLDGDFIMPIAFMLASLLLMRLLLKRKV